MDNNVIRIRREIFIRLARLFFEHRLPDQIDRIPLEMRPRDFKALSRCCVYKDRAMIKYRILASLGLSEDAETDELTPLKTYAETALAVSENPDEHLTILTEACSACIKTHYRVTDACRGCVARPCTLNCAKNSVTVSNGRAQINPDTCVNCGRCAQVCAYQAIIRIPIPCEESCPTGAISKSENGKETIDFTKCIYCGKCLSACPFGAIAERSQFLNVLKTLTDDGHTTALVAPSIAGQFPGSMQQLHSALLTLGFNAMVEVASGAELTAAHEAEEFQERMAGGAQFMTSSCCPAFVMGVQKQAVKLQPYVSSTPSPMIYAAELAKQRFPGTRTVFIGPCVAKREEAMHAKQVDYTLSFEELGAILVGKDIDVAECEPAAWLEPAHKEGRSFSVSGGVAGALKSVLGPEVDFRPTVVNGLDKKTLKQLPSKLIGQNIGNFIEVMTCEGGCIGGPCAIAKMNMAAKAAEQFVQKSEPLKTAAAETTVLAEP